MPQMLDVAEQIFEDSLLGKTSHNGIAIKDCRGKETMVIVRYGGDVCMAFFDNVTRQINFFFVIQMAKNSQKTWVEIFRRFVEIKVQLM